MCRGAEFLRGYSIPLVYLPNLNNSLLSWTLKSIVSAEVWWDPFLGFALLQYGYGLF